MSRLILIGFALAGCTRAASIAGLDAGAATEIDNRRYISVVARDDLDCVEEWEQLCSPHVLPRFIVMDGKVIGEPWIDGTEVEYTITLRSPERIALDVRPLDPGSLPPRALDVPPSTASLELKGGRLWYTGPELGALADGRVEPTILELVATAEVSRRAYALQKIFVPGGRCDGLHASDFNEVKTKCINTPDGKPPPPRR